VTAIISSLPIITVVNYSPTMQKKLMAKSLCTLGADALTNMSVVDVKDKLNWIFRKPMTKMLGIPLGKSQTIL